MKKTVVLVAIVFLMIGCGLLIYCMGGVCWDHEYVVEETISVEGFHLDWKIQGDGIALKSYSMVPMVYFYEISFPFIYPNDNTIEIHALIENISGEALEINSIRLDSDSGLLENFRLSPVAKLDVKPVLLMPGESFSLYVGRIIFPDGHAGVINGDVSIEITMNVEPATAYTLWKNVRWDDVDVKIDNISKNRDSQGNFRINGRVEGPIGNEENIEKYVNLSIFSNGKYLITYNAKLDKYHDFNIEWGGIMHGGSLAAVYTNITVKPNLVEGNRIVE